MRKKSAIATEKSLQHTAAPSYDFWLFHRETLDSYPANCDSSPLSPTWLKRAYLKVLDRLADIEAATPEPLLMEYYLKQSQGY
jgi:hypothetical protein